MQFGIMQTKLLATRLVLLLYADHKKHHRKDLRVRWCGWLVLWWTVVITVVAFSSQQKRNRKAPLQIWYFQVLYSQVGEGTLVELLTNFSIYNCYTNQRG